MTEQLKSVGIDIGTSAPWAAGHPTGSPCGFHILGGNELRLREISASLQFHGLTPAPLWGAPAVEVPIW